MSSMRQVRGDDKPSVPVHVSHGKPQKTHILQNQTEAEVSKFAQKPLELSKLSALIALILRTAAQLPQLPSNVLFASLSQQARTGKS